MNQMNQTLRELQSLESLAKEDRWVNRIHPLVKLFITVFYLILTVSWNKYHIAGVLLMAVYPMVLFTIGELSVTDAVRRLRIVLPLVCVVGIANPFFDRELVTVWGGMAVNGGVLSMLTLMGKAVLTVFAAYLLIATTSIEKICYALRLMKVPSLLVTEILLIYRYLTVLVRETKRVTDSYALRAPGQKGVHFSAWGSLAGLLLLRSMDRAERLYQSMLLRGFCGEFPFPAASGSGNGTGEKEKAGHFRKADGLYLVFWLVVLTALRVFPGWLRLF